MPKRSRTRKTRDANETAFDAVQRVISLTEAAENRGQKDPAAVALGRRGGLVGGPARAKAMTAAQRSASAQKAAQARWKAQAK